MLGLAKVRSLVGAVSRADRLPQCVLQRCATGRVAAAGGGGVEVENIAASEMLNPSRWTSMTISLARAGAGRRRPEPRWRRRHRVLRPHPPDVFGASRSGPRVVLTNGGGWRGRALRWWTATSSAGSGRLQACRGVDAMPEAWSRRAGRPHPRYSGAFPLYHAAITRGGHHPTGVGKALPRMQRRCIGQPNNDTFG